MATHEERLIEALETILGHVKNYANLTQRKRAMLTANLSVMARRLAENDPDPSDRLDKRDCPDCKERMLAAMKAQDTPLAHM